MNIDPHPSTAENDCLYCIHRQQGLLFKGPGRLDEFMTNPIQSYTQCSIKSHVVCSAVEDTSGKTARDMWYR